jgi:hypothetical protein
MGTDAVPAGMDTGEAGAAQPSGPPREKQVQAKRGARSTKQKERKRRSLEKALAVADKVETKVVRTGSKTASKKQLKKLWKNDDPK